MSFFERPPREIDDDDEEAPDDIDYSDLSSTYLGGVVPLELLLARTDSAAVALTRLIAYPDGFQLSLDTWVRKPTKLGRRLGPIHHAFDLEELTGDDLPAEILRFGIEFPDGARVTTLDDDPRMLSPDATEALHGLESSSGGGSNTYYSQEFWAWPVPESGTLTFVCEWPAYDIDETRLELDAVVVHEAAQRAQPVWLDTAAKPSRLTRAELTNEIRRRIRSGGSGSRD